MTYRSNYKQIQCYAKYDPPIQQLADWLQIGLGTTKQRKSTCERKLQLYTQLVTSCRQICPESNGAGGSWTQASRLPGEKNTSTPLRRDEFFRCNLFVSYDCCQNSPLWFKFKSKIFFFKQYLNFFRWLLDYALYSCENVLLMMLVASAFKGNMFKGNIWMA